MFGCCVRLNVCSTKIIIKKSMNAVEKELVRSSQGCHERVVAFLQSYSERNLFHSARTKFLNKRVQSSFSDFLYTLSFKNENPTKLVMRIKKIKNKLMPSNMTIITVTQGFSEARGCRNRRAYHVFSLSHALHIQYNRKLKAKTLKTPPFT